MLTPLKRTYHFRSSKSFPPGRRSFSLSKKQLILFLIISFFFFLIALATWHFILNRFRNFTGEGIELKSTFPKEVVNGEVFKIKLEYLNKERVDLQEAKLVLHYPAGFVFLESTLKSKDKGNTFELGTILPLTKKGVEIEGKIFGQIGESKVIQAILFYKPENFNSSFQKEERIKIKVGEADLNFEIDAPQQVKKGEEIKISIKYANPTEKILEDLYIEFNPPYGFVVSSITPSSFSLENKRWNLTSLEPKAEGRIEMWGQFQDEAENNSIFIAHLGVQDQFKQFYPQITRKFKVELIKLEVSLIYTANKEQNLNVGPGDLIKFNIKYKNTGSVAIKEGVIEVNLDAQYFEAESIEVGMKGLYSGGKIRWDGKADPALAELKPGEEGDLRFQARLLSENILKEKGLSQFVLTTRATMKSEDVKDLSLIRFSAESNELTLRLISGVELINEARYFDMNLERLGQGPLPPRVGEKTTYRISWIIVNNLGALENVRVVGKLPSPAKVAFENNGETSRGSDILFDSEKREIIWEVGNLEEESGDAGLYAYFDISLVPELSDIGNMVVLMPETRLSARDPVTNQDVIKEGVLLDTELETDFGAVGKGKVVE